MHNHLYFIPSFIYCFLSSCGTSGKLSNLQSKEWQTSVQRYAHKNIKSVSVSMIQTFGSRKLLVQRFRKFCTSLHGNTESGIIYRNSLCSLMPLHLLLWDLNHGSTYAICARGDSYMFSRYRFMDMASIVQPLSSSPWAHRCKCHQRLLKSRSQYIHCCN